MKAKYNLLNSCAAVVPLSIGRYFFLIVISRSHIKMWFAYVHVYNEYKLHHVWLLPWLWHKTYTWLLYSQNKCWMQLRVCIAWFHVIQQNNTVCCFVLLHCRCCFFFTVSFYIWPTVKEPQDQSYIQSCIRDANTTSSLSTESYWCIVDNDRWYWSTAMWSIFIRSKT